MTLIVTASNSLVESKNEDLNQGRITLYISMDLIENTANINLVQVINKHACAR
jgi:hypothetical protein